MYETEWLLFLHATHLTSSPLPALPARPGLVFASGALFTEIHTSLLSTPLTLQRVAVEASYCLSPSLLRCAVRFLQQWCSSLDPTHFASSFFFASFSLLHPFHLFQTLLRSLADFPAEAASLSEDLTDLLFSYLLFLHSLPHLASSLFAHAIVLFSDALLTLPSPPLNSTHCSQLLSLFSPSVPLERLFALLGLVLVSQPALLTCARNTSVICSEDSLRLFFSALSGCSVDTASHTEVSAAQKLELVGSCDTEEELIEQLVKSVVRTTKRLSYSDVVLLMLRNASLRPIVNAHLLALLAQPTTRPLALPSLTSPFTPATCPFSQPFCDLLLHTCMDAPALQRASLRTIAALLDWPSAHALLRASPHALAFAAWLVDRCPPRTSLQHHSVPVPLCRDSVACRADDCFETQKAGCVALDGVRLIAGIWYFEVECAACSGVGIRNAVKEEEVIVPVCGEETVGCLIDLERCRLACRVDGEEVGSHDFGRVDCVVPVVEVSAGCAVRVAMEKERWVWTVEEDAKCLTQGCLHRVEVRVVQEALTDDAAALRDVLVKLWDAWDMRDALSGERQQQLVKVLLEKGRANALLTAPGVRAVLPLLSTVEVEWEEAAVAQLACVIDAAEDTAWLDALLHVLLSHERAAQREVGYSLLLHCLRRGEHVTAPLTDPITLHQKALRLVAASRNRLLTREETVIPAVRDDL